MGDGSYVKKGGGVYLNTQSFSIRDNVKLMNVLMIKFRLECTLRYHSPTQPRIYIRQRSMPIVRELVKAHMAKSMLYKLGL